MRREGEGEVERLHEREKELEVVELLTTESRAYRDQGKVGQIVRLKEKKIELSKKLAEMKQPAALPLLCLQAAHFSRDSIGLLLQPLDHLLGLILPGQLPITCRAGRTQNKYKCQIFKMSKP